VLEFATSLSHRINEARNFEKFENGGSEGASERTFCDLDSVRVKYQAIKRQDDQINRNSFFFLFFFFLFLLLMDSMNVRLNYRLKTSTPPPFLPSSLPPFLPSLIL